MSITVKRITPDDPEFAAIAKTITPIEKITFDKALKYKGCYISAEQDSNFRRKRNKGKDEDKLR